ncbi:hypothetical protein GHT06_015492 [Daphnia sinensis]|uniref:Cuticular protein n=1 Tax=Daphnia sinensis TaxID=1820382 RepID=A0AAD5PUP7_9CRUS|nr:hypothetical protein GHT06_015492 [Daphnia sinensis]
MKTSVVVVVLMACAVSAQFPPGWNYNPFLYYPYTAQQPPVQETPEVAAARANHLAAHASARGSRVIVSQPTPVPVWGQPGAAVLDTPEVWAAKVEHYRAHSAAAAANGVVSTLPPLQVANWGVPQPVQDTPEVAAARAAHLAAHATARGKRSIQDTPEVMAATIEYYRAYNAAAAANGILAYLPARYANMPWGMPQQVQETPEVAAARRAHLAAHAHAAARVAKVIPVQPAPAPVWSQPAPTPVWGQPAVVQDTPEVHAAKLDFFRAFNEAATRSVVNWGVPQPVQDTPEVAAARAAHLAAHAAARVMAATIEHYRAYNAAAAANGIMAYLPARYANMPWGMPQQVQETPEVAAARRAHLAAHAHAAARVAKVIPVQPAPTPVWSQPAPTPVWSQPTAIQDTPEVHAAKVAFFRAFNEAAARSG